MNNRIQKAFKEFLDKSNIDKSVGAESLGLIKDIFFSGATSTLSTIIDEGLKMDNDQYNNMLDGMAEECGDYWKAQLEEDGRA